MTEEQTAIADLSAALEKERTEHEATKADLSAALEKERTEHEATKAELEREKGSHQCTWDDRIEVRKSLTELERKFDYVRLKLRHQGLEYILNTIPDAPTA